MKLSARRKYDYRDLEKIEAKHNSYASDMLFGEIAANWAIRSLQERALTRHSRAFGRRRGNIARTWPKRELCDSHSTWSITSGLAILRDTSEAPRQFKEGEYRCRNQKHLLMKY
jgi:hypothetical protein